MVVAAKRPERSQMRSIPVYTDLIQNGVHPRSLIALNQTPHEPMKIHVVFAAAVVFLFMSERVAAQTRECQSIKALQPQADAIVAAMRKFPQDSIDANNCQRARGILADYRSLMRQVGERCYPEGINHNISTAEPLLFGSSGWEGSIESMLLVCENEGLVPPRVSQSACSIQADYENEYAKLLREAIKFRNAERTSQVCRDAAALSRKIKIVWESWTGVWRNCEKAGTPVYFTEWRMYNPVEYLCEQPTSTTTYDFSVRDWLPSWFSGGLILVGLIWLFRLMARGYGHSLVASVGKLGGSSMSWPYGSRACLIGAILVLVGGTLVEAHLYDTWFGQLVLPPLVLFAILSLLYRFWHLELGPKLKVSAQDFRPLRVLRVRSAAIATATAFAAIFVLFWPLAFAIDGIFGVHHWFRGSSMLWGSEFFFYIGLGPLFINIELFSIVIILGAPFGAIAFVLLATALGSRGDVPRVVLLRPFNDRPLTAALRRAVVGNIAKFGYVYTLSDRHYRPNWTFHALISLVDWAEYILGPIMRPSIRYFIASSTDQTKRLGSKIKKNNGASWRTALSGNQALNIRSTDECWKSVVDEMLSNGSFVVMDLSRIGEGSAWEIQRLIERGLTPRCIFIAQKGYETGAREELDRISVGTPTINVYANSGQFLAQSEFLTAMASQLVYSRE